MLRTRLRHGEAHPDLIRQRTLAGLAVARARRRAGVRPTSMTPTKLAPNTAFDVGAAPFTATTPRFVTSSRFAPRLPKHATSRSQLPMPPPRGCSPNKHDTH